jgi:hypothetical protein
MALPITLGVTCVFAITGTTVLVYSSGSSRQAYYSTSRQGAGALSEAGLNNALAVVFKPGNNPLNPYSSAARARRFPAPRAARRSTGRRSPGPARSTSHRPRPSGR